MKVFALLENILLVLSITLLIFCGVIFFWFNKSIINNDLLVTIPLCICALVMIGSVILNVLAPKLKLKNQRVINLIVAIITFTIATILILNSVVFDYFQPIAVFDPCIYSLIFGMILYFISQIFGVIANTKNISGLMIGISILLIFIFVNVWATVQGYGKFENIESNTKIFGEKENNYSTFRIPSLVSIPKEYLNGKDENNLSNDVLIAFAEGRKDNSLDNGNIDIVSKISIDNGKTWGEMDKSLSWEKLSGVKGSIGKLGDPTVVYNKNKNKVMLFCNAGSKSGNYKLKVYLIEGIIKNNREIVWNFNNVRNLTDDLGIDMLVGPGKASVLPSGRMMYAFRSNGNAQVAFSDDDAKTWRLGGKAGEGDESEVISLGGNDLMMISRFGNMSNFPRNNSLRFAFSADGGESFKEQLSKSNLKSPVCMASITSYDTEILCSYPDSFLTRANLSIATSKDRGKTWISKRLYNGPSGYSVITTDSRGTKYIIAEIGKVEYNEEIRLFIVK